MERVLSVTMKDCDFQTFRAGGSGGQNQNKVSSGVRIIHRASGARGECREERSQLQNKRKAFKRMTDHPKFKVWLTKQLYYANESPEKRVERAMQPHNIRVEVKQDGKWVLEGN